MVQYETVNGLLLLLGILFGLHVISCVCVHVHMCVHAYVVI